MRHSQAGISYAEVLAAVLLLLLVLAPTMQALQSGVAASGIHQQLLEEQYAAAGKLEELLARSFAELEANAAGSTTPSAYSDSLLLASGRSLQRNVYVAAYDADNADADSDPNTGTDSDVLWIRVAVSGSPVVLETLISP